MNPRCLPLFLLCATAPALSAQPPQPGGWAGESAAIERVIGDMQAAWNRGDFRGYMQGFQNPGVVFVSKGRFQRDWQGTLDHYIADYGASADSRGTLCFYDIRIQPLAPDAAHRSAVTACCARNSRSTASTPG